MSVRLTVYSNTAFKDYLLPAVNNANYTLKIESELFLLSQDMELSMEILDGVWHFEDCDGSISYLNTKESYLGEALKSDDIFSVKKNGDNVSVIVYESDDSFCVYKKYDFAKTGEITIGKEEDNTFSFNYMNMISRHHAVLNYTPNGATLTDKSTNGTFVNGKKVSGTVNLSFGDCIDVFGFRLVVLGKIIACNPFVKDMHVNIEKLVQLSDENIEAGVVDRDKTVIFHRSPRNVPKIETGTVEIEAPPAPRETQQRSPILSIGPSLTMALPMLMGCLLSIYASHATGRSSGVFMYTGLVTAVGSALLGSVWAITNMKEAKKIERENELKRFEGYSEYLINCANEVKTKYETNTAVLKQTYPDALTCSKYNETSAELWNRNIRHEDFLEERLGIGSLPFQVGINIPRERFSLINDSLAEKPRMIKESYSRLVDVPICVDLFKNKRIGIIGGENRKGCFPIVYDLVTQIAANNCYTDVKMIFLYDESKEAGAEAWEFLKWFPHTWSEDKKTRFIAGNKSDAGDVLYEVGKVMRMRAEEEAGYTTTQVIPHPYYILFVEDLSILEGELITKYIYEKDEDYGITTLFLTDSYEELPNECEYVIENTNYFHGMYDIAEGIDEKIEIAFDSIGTKETEAFARCLSRIEVKETEKSGEIPNALTFFDMYGVTKPQELNVINRWKKNRTYESMRALIGQKNGGADCFLDVHEKYHGPHGLVAGTTGSGKSETLQTYMLSLAINFSPDDIGFFIIDYKGGGMANLFDGLPHMIGQISNLSGNQVRRAMVSIKSENMRRQRIFNEHGVNNINLYTRLYKNNEATTPIPHMFIIIDEFAELKREEPEFMKELISVAQVGRSLGVHLILATQKPSGTVDDNIWSNSKFRLCLRVQDRQDSSDMLHKPDAAYITQAGRGYLQVGNDELYELFQSGFSGATYDENSGVGQTNIAQMVSLDGKAALVGSHAKIKQMNEFREKWLVELIAIVKEVLLENAENSVAFAQENIKLVFEKMEEKDIDYPYSDYNRNRMNDFLNTYAVVLEETDNGNDLETARAIETYATEHHVRLPEKKEKTQLDAVVEYLADVATNNGYNHNLQLWLPVLPTEMYLSQLEGYTENTFANGAWPQMTAANSLETMVGLYDDPENQAQKPITIDLAADGNHALLGTVVSGKSTFLLTYLYSLINRYSPEVVNVYVLDYSSKMLGALSDAPHIGDVMFEDDEEKVSKFFLMLSRMLSERKKLFEGGNYSQYVRANGRVLPEIVVAIDNMASFRAKTNNVYDDVIIGMLKESFNYGIYFIVTAGGFSMNEIPNRMGENFRTTLCLEMNEVFAYSEAMRTLHVDVLPEENVKGRGIAKIGDAILEFQTALTLVADDDYKRAELLKERCKEMSDAWTGKAAKAIPTIPEKPMWEEYAALSEVNEMAKEGRYLPVGYNRSDASAYGIDLLRTYCYLVSGKSRTGKSNMLRVAISSAKMTGGDVVVIDFSGDLNSVSKQVGANYISNVDDMMVYFEKQLLPDFVERNKAKKEMVARGCSDEELFEEMKRFKRLFIFIWDLPAFIAKAEAPGGNHKPAIAFLNNLFDVGALHNVYWFASMSQDDRSKILAKDTYQVFMKRGSGIQFGGQLDRQQTFDFSSVPYQVQKESQKPGVGFLSPQENDGASSAVIPLIKA